LALMTVGSVGYLGSAPATSVLIALLYAFIPSVSRAYWIFAAMATQVYLIMYVLMFIAAMRLRRSQPGHRARDPAIALDLPAVVAADPAAGAD
jgi:amino acid transporter